MAKRTERLISSKTIFIRAIPNPYKLGLIANALIGIKCDPTKIDDICDKLGKIFNINNIHTVFGRFDIIIVVFFSSGNNCMTSSTPIWPITTHFGF